MFLSIEGFIFWLSSYSLWEFLAQFMFPTVIFLSRFYGKISLLLIYDFTIKLQKNKINDEKIIPKCNKKISILIPAFNEELGIKQCIESAIECNYKWKEIIVLDDGSRDKTFSIAKHYADKKLIRLFRLKNGGKGRALNFGATKATGEILVVLDADSLLDKNALVRAIRYFQEDKEISAISGNVRIASGDGGVDNLLTDLQKYEYLVGMDIGKRFSSIMGFLLIISGAFGMFRKDIFLNVGGYSVESKVEDFDLTLRILKFGGKLKFVNQSFVETHCPNNINELIKQRTRWSFGQIQTMLKHTDILKNLKYPKAFKVAISDMWIQDIGLSFVWIFGVILLISMLIISPFVSFELISENSIYFGLFLIIVYLISETILFVYVLLRVREKNENFWKLIYVVPILVFVYRPIIQIMTLKGYVTAFLRKQVSW